ncbi:MAG TPA: SDR family NAD(P)-dependent oxidoreductase [Acidimicrobiia bacterium]|nr:SDR family NAD(P)-dependent oxidoreductase [Acidimicrobiia bacterium]
MSVAVVTGGAVGIGAAIAEELGRAGVFVVTVDPGVAVDGSPGEGGTESTTAQRIVDAGGQARASNISVTDEDAVHTLFSDLAEEFGALDSVVNVAGISRPTGFAHGAEDDWRAVLSVHLDGYLNVLRAALPLMTAAGHGRILGVTSGSGWRAADAGAYSCAKRAVAALTWRIGRETPPGVTVNALSPIAATRMVLGALARAGASAGDSSTGGVALGLASVPPPENLGPVGAYLAGETFSSWARGEIMFSNGAELAWVVPPRLLEVARTSEVGSLLAVLESFTGKVLAPAEAAQGSNGGGNPRLGTAFEADAAEHGTSASSRAVIVTDVARWGTSLTEALAAHGVECVAIDAPATTFAAASEQLAATSASGPIDAVVVALAGAIDAVAGAVDPSSSSGWTGVLDEHAGVTEQIGNDAGWVRAVSDYAATAARAVRVVSVVDATTAGGRTRAQSAAQLSRVARAATEERVEAFTLSVEASGEGAAIGEIVAHLVCDADAGALSGAELAVGPDWFGLRSHPHPAASVSFGGPAVPEWVDGALQQMVGVGGAV